MKMPPCQKLESLWKLVVSEILAMLCSNEPVQIHLPMAWIIALINDPCQISYDLYGALGAKHCLYQFQFPLKL